MISAFLSGCGDQDIGPEKVAESPQEVIGTQGNLIYIESDNVRAAGYDAATGVMTVQFDNGYVYEYYQVPTDLWLDFVAAQPDPWSQVGYPRLVQGGYAYQRIS